MSWDDLKEEIKQIPISQVVGDYVDIKKRGANHMALCPWHNDSRPSMSVNDEKGLFKCFVCDIGGDSIGFVQKYENLDFLEALKTIGQKYSLTIPEGNKSQNEKFELGKKVIQKTALVFKRFTEDQKPHLFEEFLKNREISEEIARKFQLSFSPKNNFLTNYFKSISSEQDRAKAIDAALEIGVIKKSQTDQLFDTFRERIIFPLWDRSGNIIGFNSRSVLSTQKPKYLNSKDSFLFHKKDMIYGLHLARNQARERDRIIIAEGQMDCIALHKHGFEESVAISGVALGERALQSLLRITKNIFLALDSDEAGIKAMEKISGLFYAEGIVPRCLNFNPHKDPDEYLQDKGSLAFNELLDNAPSTIDVTAKAIFENKPIESTQEKLRVFDEIIEAIKPLGNELYAKEKVLEYASKLQLKSTPDELLNIYKSKLNQKNQGFRQPEPAQPSTPKNHTAPVIVATQNIEKINRGEKSLLDFALRHPYEFSSSNRTEDWTEILDFIANSEVKRFLGNIRTLSLEIEDSQFKSLVEDLINQAHYSQQMKDVVGGLMFNLPAPQKMEDRIFKKYAQDIKKQLKLDTLADQKNSLSAILKAELDPEERTLQMRKLSELNQEIHNVKFKKQEDITNKKTLNI